MGPLGTRLTWGSGLWPPLQPRDTGWLNWPTRTCGASSAAGDWKTEARRSRLPHTDQREQVRSGSRPADGRDGLPVLEAAEAGRVVEGLHEDLRQLLLVLGALVLLLPMFQQHVDFRVQERLGVLKLCDNTTLDK